MKTDQVSWTLTCRFCTKPFIVTNETIINADGFIICPNCNSWSGLEMKKRRFRPKHSTPIQDPGQNQIITELWAWLVSDPQTHLEGLCGFMLEGIPRMAISSSLADALKMEPFIRVAETATQKEFRLVKFAKTEEARNERVA